MSTISAIPEARPEPKSGKPLLEVKDLEQRFPVSRGLFRAPTEFVHAVDGRWEPFGDPMEAAIDVMARRLGLDTDDDRAGTSISTAERDSAGSRRYGW